MRADHRIEHLRHRLRLVQQGRNFRVLLTQGGLLLALTAVACLAAARVPRIVVNI